MVKPEAAQGGVLQAILDLHASGKFTSLLTDLNDSVLKLLIASEPAFGVQPEPRLPVGPYARSSRDLKERHPQFDDALQAWARRFRLTDDLTETGKALPWVLDFGRARCENGSRTIAPKHSVGKRPTPGWLIDGPEPNENFSDWITRIRPALRAWYVLMRKQRRTRPYTDPAKRNQDHYRWFVLRLCGRLTTGAIRRRLKFNSTNNTILKGVTSVRKALGLPRK